MKPSSDVGMTHFMAFLVWFFALHPFLTALLLFYLQQIHGVDLSDDIDEAGGCQNG